MTTRWDPIEPLPNQDYKPRLASPLIIWWTVRRLAKQKQQVGPGEVFGAVVTVELTQQLTENHRNHHWLSPEVTKTIIDLIRQSFEPKRLTISQPELRVVGVSKDNHRLIRAHFYVA